MVLDMWTSIVVVVLAASEPAGSAGSEFNSNWDTVPDRTWIGADWWANRLQDWRVEDGTLRCTEARPRMAMRTAQLEVDGIAVEDATWDRLKELANDYAVTDKLHLE